MVVEYCICDAIVPIDTETRVVLVVHFLEWQKTTTTSALLRLVLENAEVRLRGVVERPFEGDDLVADPTRRPVLLYPSPDAIAIDALPRDRPITLIVPDGTWRQARKVRLREPAFEDLVCVTLPEGTPSQYRVRRNTRGTFALSTAEAVARALGILEGQVVEDAVLRPFERMVANTMTMRGRS